MNFLKRLFSQVDSKRQAVVDSNPAEPDGLPAASPNQIPIPENPQYAPRAGSTPEEAAREGGATQTNVKPGPR